LKPVEAPTPMSPPVQAAPVAPVAPAALAKTEEKPSGPS